jgi:hypothetical protein
MATIKKDVTILKYGVSIYMMVNIICVTFSSNVGCQRWQYGSSTLTFRSLVSPQKKNCFYVLILFEWILGVG